MRWSIVAPEDSAWESDLEEVLRDLFEHDVACVRTPEDLRDTDAVVLCGDEAWAEHFLVDASAAETLGRKVVDHATEGGLLLCIGWGFKVACALGLLPGRVEANDPSGFLCRMVTLRVESVANPWAERATVGDVWQMPLRTSAGRYVAEDATLDQLERDGRVLLRFVDDPVGASRGIAGVMSSRRNILGLAVHPENVVDASLVEAQWPGLESGRVLFDSVADWIETGVRRAIESER